jgi:hypothetical protein
VQREIEGKGEEGGKRRENEEEIKGGGSEGSGTCFLYFVFSCTFYRYVFVLLIYCA